MRQLLVRIAMKLGVYKWCVDVDTNLREALHPHHPRRRVQQKNNV